MITTDPVGDWMWEVAAANSDIPPSRAVELAMAVGDALTKARIAVPGGEIEVTARDAGATRDIRQKWDRFRLPRDRHAAQSMLAPICTQVDSLAEDALISVRISCPGQWREHGNTYQAEELFTIRSEVWGRDFLALTLETYSDVWLTMDTRGREQAEIHAANYPRLTLALEIISKIMGAAPTPGDENRYAIPTETGFADTRAEGPAYEDAWGTFEPAARMRRLRSSLPHSEDDYEETTEKPVQYVTVNDDEGVLGYLWAAQGDDAACFEPRTAAGERAFSAGRIWLMRLREAHRLGIAALEVPTWLSQQPPLPGAGRIMDAPPRVVPSLDALEELSGRW
ncbi:hypothetical protein ABZ733_30490 [Streptomyces longwoodensis]|uniref:hypothetical protein n=1 Tax=Streptomyces longwoodensis TaxID=68231 RepID=UPI0033F7170F